MTQRWRLHNLYPRISTHTLTWSVTITNVTRLLVPVISTHTLTWSVTCVAAYLRKFLSDFNSHAHVERDLKQLRVLKNL